MTAKEALMAALCTARAKESNEKLPENTVAAREGAIVGDNAVAMDSIRLVRGREVGLAMDAKGVTVGPDGIEEKNVGRGTPGNKNAAAAKIESSIAEHDQRFHKNGFDPKKSRCKFREKMAAQAEAMGIAGQVDNLGWVDDGQGGETLMVHGDDRTETANSQEWKGYQDQLAAINEKYKEFGGKLSDTRVDKMTPEEKAAWEKKKGEVEALRSAYLDTALGMAEASSIKHLQDLAAAGGELGGQAVEVAKGILADEGSSDAQKEGARAILEARASRRPPRQLDGIETAEEVSEGTEETPTETTEATEPPSEGGEEEPIAEEAEPEEGGDAESAEAGQEEQEEEPQDMRDDYDPEYTAELARLGYDRDGKPIQEEEKRQAIEAAENAARQQRIDAVAQQGEEAVAEQKKKLEQMQKRIESLVKQSWDPESAKKFVAQINHMTPEQMDEMNAVIDGATKALFEASDLGQELKAAEEAIGEEDGTRKRMLNALRESAEKAKTGAQKASLLGRIERLKNAASEERKEAEEAARLKDDDPVHQDGGVTASTGNVPRNEDGTEKKVDMSFMPTDDGKEPGFSKAEEAKQHIMENMAEVGLETRGAIDTKTEPKTTTFSIPLKDKLTPSRRKNLIDRISIQFPSEQGNPTFRYNPSTNSIDVTVPNDQKGSVSFGKLINSDKWKDYAGKTDLPMLLGQDENGEMLSADLTELTHLLIAGATDAGKSARQNNILMSLTSAKTPDDVQLVLVDPKRVEFSQWKNSKYLARPVITNMDEAAKTFDWAVNEQENRYKLFEQAGVSNIKEYNAKGKAGLLPPGLPKKLPRMVMIVDEYADLMDTHGDEVEKSIERLSQKARAAGIHLILTTQRPDKKVITGKIRANIPSVLGLSTAKREDSGVIGINGLHNLPPKGPFILQTKKNPEGIRGEGGFIEGDTVKEYNKRSARLYSQPTESGHEVGDEIKFKPKGGGEQKTARVGADGKWHEVNADGSEGRELKFKNVPKKKAEAATPAPTATPTTGTSDTNGTAGTAGTSEGAEGSTATPTPAPEAPASPEPTPAPEAPKPEAPATPKNHITKNYNEWKNTPEAVEEIASMKPGEYRTFEGLPGYYLEKTRNGEVKFRQMPEMPEMPEAPAAAANPSPAPATGKGETQEQRDARLRSTVDVKGKNRRGTAGAAEGQSRGNKEAMTPVSHADFVRAQNALPKEGGWKLDGGDSPMQNGRGEIYARHPTNGSYGFVDKDGQFHYVVNTQHPSYKGVNSPEAKAAKEKWLNNNLNEEANGRAYRNIAYGTDEMPIEVLKELFEGR